MGRKDAFECRFLRINFLSCCGCFRTTSPSNIPVDTTSLGNGLGMELCKENRIEKEKGLTYHSWEQREGPEQGPDFWATLALLTVSSTLLNSSRFHSSLHFRGNLFQLPFHSTPPPLRCHLCLLHPGYQWSLPWPLVLYYGLSFFSNSSLPTQIISPLSCERRGVRGSCLLSISQPPSQQSVICRVSIKLWLLMTPVGSNHVLGFSPLMCSWSGLFYSESWEIEGQRW